VDLLVQVRQPIFETFLVFSPCDAIDPGRSISPKAEEAFPEKIDRHMVHQGSEPSTPISTCCFSHTLASSIRISPALSPECGTR
jgi:hypothetical protein